MILKACKHKTMLFLFFATSIAITQGSYFLYAEETSHERTINQEFQLFDLDLDEIPTEQIQLRDRKSAPKKPWTFIVYMSADNDLRNFAARNLKQMTSIGSTEHINIVVHLDIRLSDNKKITRRYYIEKDTLLNINPQEGTDVSMDSGDPATLISCCNWAIKNYPADDYALIFWNHGSGIIDPERGRVIIHPTELFNFNPASNKLELDRSIGFLDLMMSEKDDQRGICWDESTGHYLTNQKLDGCLKDICSKLLHGKKFSLIGFDACLMSMVEIASLLEPYAEIMVGSQEVELGTGWNYAHVLHPFTQHSLNKHDFAEHIVYMYEKTYKAITGDYTQSAIDLQATSAIEQSIHEIAQVILEASPHQTNYSIRNGVREARKKNKCTHFDEPSYIDLLHFFKNLLTQIPNMTLSPHSLELEFKKNLQATVENGINTIKKSVIANVCGLNLSQAGGLSIYFPERKLHPSYALTNFSKNNAWSTLISQYTEPHRALIECAVAV